VVIRVVGTEVCHMSEVAREVAREVGKREVGKEVEAGLA
jgi:hypothetical protein